MILFNYIIIYKTFAQEIKAFYKDVGRSGMGLHILETT